MPSAAASPTFPSISRRDFLRASGVAAGVAAFGAPVGLQSAEGTLRPNILWISTEDISPDLGCYGDAYAVTPNIDAFAKGAVRYDNAYAHMGVCAPARSGIITGMYPTSMGTNHMRCRGVPQPEVRCFTEHLRAAGYYCTNRSKTDYQFNSPMTAWDKGKADWRGRPEGSPFFSVINIGTTHESQIRSARRRKECDQKLSADELHDPTEAVLPPYYPDTSVVRKDWAQYYDIITLMDRQVADILAKLEEDGLAEDTIVWFWGDHGRGLPRGKRWIYDSGLKFPLIIRIPRTLRAAARGGGDLPGAGGSSSELVSFVDFAPTMLSLAGIPVPPHIQGQAFLGTTRAAPRRYIYAARDRVDEAFDMIRAVRDGRFKYIRNFMAHLPRSLDVSYMNQMPTMKEMRRLYAEGKLSPGPQMQYFEPTKPVEELYDCASDPHEVSNLATDPAHRTTLLRLREVLFDWMREMGDFGLLPEPEFDAVKRPGDTVETAAAPGFSVAAADDSRGNVVAIRSTTPGASIACAVDRRRPEEIPSGIVLGVEKATIHGKGLKRRPGRGITNWIDPKTWVSWTVNIPRAGKMPVHVLQARVGAGRPYEVRVGESVLKGMVQNTEDWSNHQHIHLGEVSIPAAGKYTVSLRPTELDKRYSMDLKAVVLDGRNLSTAKGDPEWGLYSNPVVLQAGQRLRTKACRLGFRDSKVVEYRAGETPAAPEANQALPHWRHRVSAEDLERILALKRLDGQGEAALRQYRRVLSGSDPCASMRYWAVLGLHTASYGSASPVPASEAKELFTALLTDPAAIVRITAAMALCQRGFPKRALPVLVKELEGNPLASGKHFAATALHQVGEQARPVLSAIQAGAKAGGYTARTCKNILAGLE